MNPILSDPIYAKFALGSLVLLISIILLRRGKNLELNEPPFVPYKYPIIGHTIEYFTDNEGFIKRCHEEYGEIFSLYVFGKTLTFVGKEHASEIFKNHQKFDPGAAQSEMFPMGECIQRPLKFFENVTKVVQENFGGGLKHYVERIQRQLNKSVDAIIGDGKVLESPTRSFQFIIAKPIAATLVGEELSDDKELVNSFAYATSDFSQFLTIPPILSFIHPLLHKKVMVMAFRYLNNPYKVHRGLIKSKLVPLIESRVNEMKRLGDSYTPPVDLLQRYIEIFYKDYVVDIEAVMDCMIATIFASVHTTSGNLTFCLQEFVNNPQFHKEILEEQEQIYKNNKGHYYSHEQINQMEKLDSFIRETLRVVNHSVALPRKTVVPYHTFSNGYQVPQDRFVFIRTGEIHSDDKLYGQNSNEFDALRHLKKSSASRTERSFLVFGLGKHACPGRFFAINEIKIALHHLLLRYNIRKVNDEKIVPISMGPMKVPNDEALIFEKKKEVL